MHRLFRLAVAALCLTFATVGATAKTAEAFRTSFLAGKKSWQQVLDRARQEGKVTFFYWGGNDVLNVWMDSHPGQAVAKLGIRMVSSHLTETCGAVDLVIEQTAAGKAIDEGAADLVWINGENFLFGDFAERLPNSGHFDWNEKDRRSHPNFFDFGTPIMGREIPWSSEQYVCSVNRAHVSPDRTPSTFADLKIYRQNNPGTFSYVAPPAEAGITFVLAAIYAFSPDGHAPFQKPAKNLGATELSRLMAPGMDYLKSLKPFLLQGDDGKPTYLEDAVAANRLFRQGDIHFACEFGTYRTATRITTGRYSNSAEALIFPMET